MTNDLRIVLRQHEGPDPDVEKALAGIHRGIDGRRRSRQRGAIVGATVVVVAFGAGIPLAVANLSDDHRSAELANPRPTAGSPVSSATIGTTTTRVAEQKIKLVSSPETPLHSPFSLAMVPAGFVQDQMFNADTTFYFQGTAPYAPDGTEDQQIAVTLVDHVSRYDLRAGDRPAAISRDADWTTMVLQHSKSDEIRVRVPASVGIDNDSLLEMGATLVVHQPPVAKGHLVAIEPAPKDAPFSLGLVPEGFSFRASPNDNAQTLYADDQSEPDSKFTDKVAVIMGQEVAGLKYPVTCGGKPAQISRASKGDYSDVVNIKERAGVVATVMVPKRVQLSDADLLRMCATLDVRDPSAVGVG